MLDTDICIYAINGRTGGLQQRLEGAVGAVCMSSLTFAELSYGAERSQRVDDNLVTLHSFKRLVPVRTFDEAAALDYGLLKGALFRAGTPCGPFDMLIGAHARSLGLTLVTNNRREFDRMPGLKVENWVA